MHPDAVALIILAVLNAGASIFCIDAMATANNWTDVKLRHPKVGFRPENGLSMP